MSLKLPGNCYLGILWGPISHRWIDILNDVNKDGVDVVSAYEYSPKCDSDDIIYYPPEIEGEALSYESECKDCGLQFYEQYYVKYENSYGIEFPEEPTT